MHLRWVFRVAVLLTMAATSTAASGGKVGPPAIAKGITCSDWRHCAAASNAFTRVLLKRFPLGTSEQVLRYDLRAQGFQRPRGMPERCLRPGELAEVGATAIACPLWDPNWDTRDALSVEWGGLPCGSEALVRWSAGPDRKITHLDGTFGVSCM